MATHPFHNLFGRTLRCRTCGEQWDRTENWQADVAFFAACDTHCVACCEYEHDAADERQEGTP